MSLNREDYFNFQRSLQLDRQDIPALVYQIFMCARHPDSLKNHLYYAQHEQLPLIFSYIDLDSSVKDRLEYILRDRYDMCHLADHYKEILKLSEYALKIKKPSFIHLRDAEAPNRKR